MDGPLEKISFWKTYVVGPTVCGGFQFLLILDLILDAVIV